MTLSNILEHTTRDPNDSHAIEIFLNANVFTGIVLVVILTTTPTQHIHYIICKLHRH